MVDTASSFDGVVDQIIPLVPNIRVGSGQADGIPMFKDIFTGQYEAFDPWNLMAEDEINSTVMSIYGDKTHGKTTTAIAMAERFGGRRAGNRRIRITGDVHRVNDDIPEMDRLAKFYDTELIDLSSYELNLLDMAMGMKFSQQLGMVRRCLQHVFEKKFSVAEREALRIALKKVRKLFPESANLKLLAFVLRTMVDDDFIEVQRALHAQLQQEHGNDAAFSELSQNFLGHEQRKLTPGVKRACLHLASQIEELLDGEYRGIFGGKNSLKEVLSRRCVLFDYSSLSDEAIVLVQAMIWEWRAAALTNRDMRFHFDIDIHDENHKMWQFEVYAVAMSKYLKQARSYGTFIILITHRMQDYRTVGKTSSRVHQLATNMTGDIDMALIGHLDHKAAKEVAKRYNLSPMETEVITQQSRGRWALVVGTQRARFVELVLEPHELEDSYSNKANDRMAIMVNEVSA